MTINESKVFTDLDSVLDLASVVSDDEGRLHDGRELDVTVRFMLPLELIQQSLVSGLRETGKKRTEEFNQVLHL